MSKIIVPAKGNRGITDLERIIALPRRDINWMPPDISQHCRRPGGTMTVREVQARALYTALLDGGLLGFIGVGRGKTLICLLLAELLRMQLGIKPTEVVLLIPPEMRNGLRKEWHKYAKHWNLPHGINVLTYTELSRPGSSGRLDALNPKAIICDEADKLRNPDAATTKRFLRYLNQHSVHVGGHCRLYAMSGTMAKRSIKDWAHIAKFALGTNSPVPLEWGALQTFCSALDVRKGQEEDARACAVVGRLQTLFGGATLREGFRRRLESAPGVVISTDQGIDATAVVQPRTMELPPAVADYYKQLENDWTLPDGTVTEDALEANRKLRELSLGFYYEWIWPDDEPDYEWLEARQNWHRSLREWLPHSATGTDSPALVERLCIAWAQHMELHAGSPKDAIRCEQGGACKFLYGATFTGQDGAPVAMYPKPMLKVPEPCHEAYAVWAQQKHKPAPPTRAVWLDHFAVHDAVQWVKEQKGKPCLIWYEHDVFGYAVAQAGGFKFIDSGAANHALLETIEAQTIVLSRHAHYRGKNLQDRWCTNLITCPVSGGAVTEQHYGRTLRPGQEADEVLFAVNTHTKVLKRALTSARADARFIEDSHGTRQILCHATYLRTVKATPVAGTATQARVHVLPKNWGLAPNGTYAAIPLDGMWKRHPADEKALRRI